jgi:hypothetical protein
MRKHPVVFVLAIALMVVAAIPAGATPSSGVNIEVESSLLGAPGPFTASGPAVDDGLMCSEGTVIDESGKVTGFSPAGFNYQGIKRFTCEDGSGEIFVNLQARIDFRKGTTFNWNVLSGTGGYEDLHGAGSGVGLPFCGPDCVLDVYDGGLHIDPRP